ncbi:MAG: thiamine pyrophosphate-dependent enzyme [Candidatus Hodarchaeota archaeon]
MVKDSISWCPGCGNFGMLKTLKETFAELKIPPEQLVLVSGIGQAAKLPHYMQANMFQGLHGRYLSHAIGIKIANPQLTVIAQSGDGCTYSEGGNHFLHAIRYNPDITNIVHNNMVYGLTKGQASPTSPIGLKTQVQITGAYNHPFNPLTVAIGLDASFVARAYIGDAAQTKEIFKKAIQHKGYAFVDVFCPCVSFNRINTYQWFKANTYYLDESHDPYDQTEAFKRAIETTKLPLGIFYLSPDKPTFKENVGIYREDSRPLFQREVNKVELESILRSLG